METNVNDSLEVVLESFHVAANASLAKYAFLADAHIKLLDYSENATYLIETKSNEKYIMRVNRPNYLSKTEIESEIKWLELLHNYSPVQVSLPIKADTGEYVNTNVVNNTEYYSTLFTFLEGKEPSVENEEDLIRQFELLGKVTATVHKYMVEHYDEFKDFNRMTWDEETLLGDNPTWGKWQDGKGLTPERIELFEQAVTIIKDRLSKYGKSPTRFGLIHSDLRLANLLVDGNTIKIIDFDDCGFSWYLYDFATAVSFMEHMPIIEDLTKAWVKGYTTIRELSEEDLEMIPTFILLRRLQLISWIGSRDNELSRSKGDEYTIQADALIKQYIARNVNQ